jgi:aryl-alcohol dehydrogenase
MLNVVKPTAGSTVLIVGAGAVGLAALMAVKLAPSNPSKVIVVDIVSDRLGLAKRYGATNVVDMKDHPDLKATLMAITEGKGVDGAIDTTGRPEIVGKLLESAAKKGVVVTVGVGSVSISGSLTWPHLLPLLIRF